MSKCVVDVNRIAMKGKMSEYVVDVNRIAMRGWISVLGMLTGLL